MLEKRELRDTFKIFKGGKELYTHKFIPEDSLCEVIYIRPLNCYFLFVNNTIYRKDINQRAPYHYMKILKQGENVNYLLPVSEEKVFIVLNRMIKMINFLQKKVVFCFRFLPPPLKGVSDQRNLYASLFGGKGQKLAILDRSSSLIWINLKRRKIKIIRPKHYPNKPCFRDGNFFSNQASFAVSRDQKYMFTFASSFTFWRKGTRAIFRIFQVSNRKKIHQKLKVANLDKLDNSSRCILRFLGQSKGRYLLIGFFLKTSKKNIVPLVYDSNENTLEVLHEKKVKLGNRSPLVIKQIGRQFFAVGDKLEFCRVSISN